MRPGCSWPTGTGLGIPMLEDALGVLVEDRALRKELSQEDGQRQRLQLLCMGSKDLAEAVGVIAVVAEPPITRGGGWQCVLESHCGRRGWLRTRALFWSSAGARAEQMQGLWQGRCVALCGGDWRRSHERWGLSKTPGVDEVLAQEWHSRDHWRVLTDCVLPERCGCPDNSLHERMLQVLRTTTWKVSKRPGVAEQPVQSESIGVKSDGSAVWWVASPQQETLLAFAAESLLSQVGVAQWTSLAVNHGFAAAPHIDAGNVGRSWVMSLGEHTGGLLWIQC